MAKKIVKKGNTELNEKNIADRLFKSAELRAFYHGLEFHESSGFSINEMAKKAAKNIVEKEINEKEEVRTEIIRASIRFAVDALNTFVDQMAMERFSVYNNDELKDNFMGEKTFENAKAKLCPVWPICK